MSLQQTLEFLTELAANNEKAWFDANRSRYKSARAAFEDLIAELIGALAPVADLGDLTPRECLFRINRDVRFAKDKSPYHTAMTAAIGRGGRHGAGRSYFLQIAPGDSFVGSGLFEPDATALDNLRQHIAADAQPLRAIIAAPPFVSAFGTLQGSALKTAPSGYDRNHPAIDLLRYKQLLAVHRLSDAAVVSGDVVPQIVAACVAMGPFLDYLDRAAATPSR